MPWEQFPSYNVNLTASLCLHQPPPILQSSSQEWFVRTQMIFIWNTEIQNNNTHRTKRLFISSIWPNMISTRCVHSALRRDLQRSANSWCRGFVAFGAPAFYAGCIFFCHQVFDPCPISVSKIHYSYAPLQHNTAKSTRQPLQKLRMYSKMFSAPGGGDAAFRYVGNFICVWGLDFTIETWRLA